MLKILLEFWRRKRFKRAKDAWFRHCGDDTLRLDYPLTANSIVFDVGGYQGDFAAAIHARFKCQVHVFEPVAFFREQMAVRFAGLPKIIIHPFGLAAADGQVRMNLAAESSSHVKPADQSGELCELRAFSAVAESLGVGEISLMKVNIEGAEFELIEHILDRSWAARIVDLQVQFHLFVPDAAARRRNLRRRLRGTHQPTYEYYFIWENWRRRVSTTGPI